MNCPDCRTENPDVAKFCMNCGRSLAETLPVAASRRLAVEHERAVESSTFKLDRYLPQELITKLEAARSRNSMVGNGE